MGSRDKRKGGGRSPAPSRRRWILPTAALVVVLLAGALAASLGGADEGSPGAAAQQGVSASTTEATAPAEIRAYYDDVALSLSPLLHHVQRIKLTLRTLLDETETPSASLADVVAPWAEDTATARDLVGRLIPPEGPQAQQTRELYTLGTMLYLESVHTLARTPKISDTALRHEVGRSGLRVYALADRLLDQAKRLLERNGRLQEGTRTLPAEVPDFVGENLQPGASGPLTPEGSGFAGADGRKMPVRRWSERNRKSLVDAMSALRQATGPSPLAPAELETLAGELDAASTALGEVVPDHEVAREGAIALRLALLVEAESLRVAASPAQDGAKPIADRLRLIGDRLWAMGAGMLQATGGSVPAGGIGDPGLDSALLRQGGVFGGNPPPLQPGDPPDKDVPGGLKLPDASKTFSG